MFVTGLIRIMQAAGVEYEVVPGWQTRSLWRAGLSRTIRAAMYHTTESVDSSFTSGRDAPTLQYCVNGLGYPLYNVLFGRSGKAYIIAAGSAAHAGHGSGGGMTRDDANREAIAFSFDANSSRYPVTAAQLESAAKVGKAMTDDWGGNLVHMMHGEWSVMRSDPTRVPGGWAALKAAIRRGSWSNASPAATRPNPTPAAPSKPVTPTPTMEGPVMSAEEYAEKTWRYTGRDFVNENPQFKDTQLARTYQYTQQTRAEVRELKAMVKALAAAQDKGTGKILEAVEKAERDVIKANAKDVAAELQITTKED
ncbi:N-acetylmuramoyl-L-alanine amidase [Nesterenkonia jeotgali]|uniref:N-acetylmuramoyl-L-alanine amidase domain-containing protein n=1 Tax=Nesterenkonia jeotgali TaxID=317018 RepID=A0A0W8IG75_9MICC|nr:N-acetylmuramoyl-L-alanine amidase [Nesterenkonia jeotgali]KUG58993.1 hypothetical protein AVL63_02930 [Nesterenkonia jeotgali]